jgi:coenzyme F420-0:L-glutamate ligase / coenzyme F420-1:gamma-L-glutamate ligase
LTNQHLTIIPVKAPIERNKFPLHTTIVDAIAATGEELQDGDVLAVSSKYAAISEGRVVQMEDVRVSHQAAYIAERFVMDPRLVQLVIDESDHIFGGITHDFNGKKVGFLLTSIHGIISPNAGLDRSNIPDGQVVLFPSAPYYTAANIRRQIRTHLGVDIGVILTDSWLMPGRLGTTGVALSTAGFKPVQDERGKIDLFGNPMQVTQVGVADSICVCAQMVMGETAEATPLAIVRNTGVELTDLELGVDDVSISWEMCIYVGALTKGTLEDLTPMLSAKKNGKSIPQI